MNNEDYTLEFMNAESDSERLTILSETQDINLLYNLDNPSLALQLLALQIDPILTLNILEQPSYELIDKAIDLNPYHITIMNCHLPDDLILKALHMAPYTFGSIVKQCSRDIKIEALKLNSSLIYNITDSTEEMQLIAINDNIANLAHIREPFRSIEKIAASYIKEHQKISVPYGKSSYQSLFLRGNKVSAEFLSEIYPHVCKEDQEFIRSHDNYNPSNALLILSQIKS